MKSRALSSRPATRPNGPVIIAADKERGVVPAVGIALRAMNDLGVYVNLSGKDETGAEIQLTQGLA